MRWVLLAAIGAGCVFTPEDDDCEALAIRDADGNVDPCDLQACEACDAVCDDHCLVLDSFPPQYACDGEGTFSAPDECPDWAPPAR